MAARHPSKVESQLSNEWRRWIAESKMQGLEDQALLDVMVQSGVDAAMARDELRALGAHPYFQAGDAMAQRLRKAQSILGVYQDLGALLPAARFQAIERRSNLTREEFLEKYYAANRPVVLLNLMSDWRALSRWTPEYLQATCGDELVEIMARRNSDPRYEINSDAHRTTIPFREYVDRVVHGGTTNDFYLVANNNLFAREGMKPLYEDIVLFPEYLDADAREGCVFLWFGPAGTVTPLHHDLLNIFMAQVRGRKRITLISSGQTPLMYNDVGVYSDIDPNNPDYDRFPLFRHARMTRLLLRPGEVLFVPVGWWHHVEALDVSITVSLSNFVFENQYTWNNPDIHY